MLSFCPNNDTLRKVFKDGGFSRCFVELFTPSVLMILIIVSFIIQLRRYWKCKKMKKYRKLHVQNGGRGGIEIDQLSPHCKKHFKGFAFSELPRPFWYVVQWLLHACLIILPAADLLSRLILCPSCLHGSVLYQDVMLIFIWGFALRNLQRQRKMFYRAHVKSHSLLFLLFWSLSLLVDIFALVSWNSHVWWFSGPKTEVKRMELFVFSIRFSSNLILFVLGFLAPGLYKEKRKVLAEGEESEKKKSKVFYINIHYK